MMYSNSGLFLPVSLKKKFILKILNSLPTNSLIKNTFLVFDGHAGSRVATHSSENLLEYLLNTPEFKDVS